MRRKISGSRSVSQTAVIMQVSLNWGDGSCAEMLMDSRCILNGLYMKKEKREEAG